MPEPELVSLKQRGEAAGVAEDKATSVETLLSSRRRTTPTKTSAASSATAGKTSRLDPYPVPLVSRNP
jgi:hypothetical protein